METKPMIVERVYKRTRLKLSHEELDSFPQENPNFRVESFTGGWNYFVNESLVSFVEQR
ncbi:hypothetical protein [Pedobacter ginsengisoli]|uniref:hypothetical protein n=1 Tax=Pedobacter ginsengisoli TaxID=363852 RepID=UPI00254D35DC|nr:hypothetical protein [Pedobacter ginsengisoli]